MFCVYFFNNKLSSLFIFGRRRAAARKFGEGGAVCVLGEPKEPYPGNRRHRIHNSECGLEIASNIIYQNINRMTTRIINPNYANLLIST